MQTLPQLETLLRSNFWFDLSSTKNKSLKIISPEADRENSSLLIGPREGYVLDFGISNPHLKKEYLVSSVKSDYALRLIEIVVKPVPRFWKKQEPIIFYSLFHTAMDLDLYWERAKEQRLYPSPEEHIISLEKLHEYS